MLDLIVSTPPSHAAAAAPDWFARGLSVASIVLTVVLFVIGQRGKAWRGRRDDLALIAQPLGELRLAIEAVRQNATNAYQLWSIPNSAAMDALQEASEAFPDRRLRADLDRLHQRLTTARGNSYITAEPGQDPPPLKGKQLAALTEAAEVLKRIDVRILTIKRKGSVS